MFNLEEALTKLGICKYKYVRKYSDNMFKIFVFSGNNSIIYTNYFENKDCYICHISLNNMEHNHSCSEKTYNDYEKENIINTKNFLRNYFSLEIRFTFQNENEFLKKIKNCMQQEILEPKKTLFFNKELLYYHTIKYFIPPSKFMNKIGIKGVNITEEKINKKIYFEFSEKPEMSFAKFKEFIEELDQKDMRKHEREDITEYLDEIDYLKEYDKNYIIKLLKNIDEDSQDSIIELLYMENVDYIKYLVKFFENNTIYINDIIKLLNNTQEDYLSYIIEFLDQVKKCDKNYIIKLLNDMDAPSHDSFVELLSDIDKIYMNYLINFLKNNTIYINDIMKILNETLYGYTKYIIQTLNNLNELNIKYMIDLLLSTKDEDKDVIIEFLDSLDEFKKCDIINFLRENKFNYNDIKKLLPEIYEDLI